MNEAETRAELIDPKLRGSGWGVVASNGKEIYQICMQTGPESLIAALFVAGRV